MNKVECINEELKRILEAYRRDEIGLITYCASRDKLYKMLDRTTEEASQTVRVDEQHNEGGLVQSPDNAETDLVY